MLKAPTNARQQELMRCKDCIYYSRARAASKEDRCVELGVRELAKTCEEFLPEHHQLAKVDPNTLKSLGLLLRDLDDGQTRHIEYALSIASKLKRIGFKFGQPVWFEYGGKYRKGYVISVITVTKTEDGNTTKGPCVVVSARGLSEIRSKPTTAYLPPSSVFKKDPTK